MIRDKIESIKKRIGRIEPVEPVVIWPPREGSLEYCIWQSLGQPLEPMTSMELLEKVSEDVWEDENVCA
jgi:hypothetical protein